MADVQSQVWALNLDSRDMPAIDFSPRASMSLTSAVFARAAQEMRHARAASALPARGYRVFFSHGPDWQSIDLPLAPETYAIAGRHKRCHIRLHEDPDLSMRHLFLRPEPASDGTAQLRVLDLRAGVPFFLQDDAPRHAVLGSGSVIVRVGRYVIAALPVDDDASWREDTVPKATVRDSLKAQWTLSENTHESTQITMLSAVTEIPELHEPVPSGHEGVITVTRGESKASVGVTRDALERGVMVGRASRCLDGGLRHVLNEEVSRAHMLMLWDGGAIRAFDLCSTNGMRQLRGKTSVITMGARTKLRLSGRNGVKLYWRWEGAI